MGIPIPVKMVFILEWTPGYCVFRADPAIRLLFSFLASLYPMCCCSGFCFDYTRICFAPLKRIIFGFGQVTPSLLEPLSWCCTQSGVSAPYFNGLVQERRNSSAIAMELRLSCTNPIHWQPAREIWGFLYLQMSCNDLMIMWRYQDSNPSSTGRTTPHYIYNHIQRWFLFYQSHFILDISCYLFSLSS